MSSRRRRHTDRTSERIRIVSLRYVAALVVVVFGIFLCGDSRADARVPLPLQAQLISRLGTFDRNFANRAGSVALVLVVSKPGNAESKFEANSVARSLEGLRQIGGIATRIEQIELTDGPALAARCRANKVALVYFATGLESEMSRVSSSLDGVDVLTVGSSAQHAENGAVVGFGLEEARPKLILNMKRAKSQNVSFKAELLKLARIIE